MRYGRVEDDSSALIMTGYASVSLPHDLFGWGQCLDVGRTGKDSLSVLQKGRRVLAEVDAVVVQAPQQRGNRDVEHREVVAQHVLVLEEHGRKLRETVANVRASLLQSLFVALRAAI